MVAAVLESAGYHYQSHILDEMTPAFTGSLGGLIYLVGVAVTIFAVAIRGGYRFGPWLLIGPPLFFSMVLPRSEIDHVQWKFGQQERDEDGRVPEEVAKLNGEGGGAARVSTMFAKYTKLVSGTVQEMVKVINKDKTDTDKWFIIRAQLLSRLYGRNSGNGNLQQLIEYSLFKTCGDYVAAARELDDPRLSERAKKGAEERMQGYDTVYHRIISLEAAQEIADLRKAFDLRNGGTGDAPGPALSTEVNDILDPETFTCKQIWFYVYLGLVREGRATVMRVRDDMSINGINVPKGLQQLGRAMGLVSADAPDIGTADEGRILDQLAYASAKFILRNESNRNSYAGRLEESAMLSREFDHVEAPIENQLAQTELARARSTEWAEKTRLMTAASNLPYYQGLLLYFLSIAFPFFALLLLVPGKHGAFILWFILWLWVKSWDVAMAIVMQLDDVLFSMLSLSKELHKSPVEAETLSNQFTTAILALRVSDPTFQMTTYYNILGACLTAIPVVTAQLILGSLNSGAGVIAAGMKAMSEDLSEGSAKVQSQAAVSNSRHQHQELAMARASLYFRNRMGTSLSSTNPRTGRPFHEAYGFNSLAGKIGSPGQFSAREERSHITFGPNNTVHRSGARFGDNAGYTLNERTSTAKLFSGIQGAASALGRSGGGVPGPAGFLFPKSPMTTSAMSAVPGLMKVTAGGIDQAAGAYSKYLFDTADAEVNPAMQWALFDSNYSERAKQLAAQARIYNQLEVPWTVSGDVGEIAETDLELSFRSSEEALKASWIEAAAGFSGDVVKETTGY